MTPWLEVGRLAAAGNIGLLVALSYVWVRNYRRHGARHTLALLVFGAFLLLENVVWVYLYVLNAGYIAWYRAATLEVQVAVTGLCLLEFIALVVLTRLTWQ